LILPDVVIFHQGLNHANLRVLEFTREVCVRLITRLKIYGTKEGLVPFRLDNFVNYEANTRTTIPLSSNHVEGRLEAWDSGCIWPKLRSTPLQRQILLLRQANEAEAWQ